MTGTKPFDVAMPSYCPQGTCEYKKITECPKKRHLRIRIVSHDLFTCRSGVVQLLRQESSRTHQAGRICRSVSFSKGSIGEKAVPMG